MSVSLPDIPRLMIDRESMHRSQEGFPNRYCVDPIPSSYWSGHHEKERSSGESGRGASALVPSLRRRDTSKGGRDEIEEKRVSKRRVGG